MSRRAPAALSVSSTSQAGRSPVAVAAGFRRPDVSAASPPPSFLFVGGCGSSWHRQRPSKICAASIMAMTSCCWPVLLRTKRRAQPPPSATT